MKPRPLHRCQGEGCSKPLRYAGRTTNSGYCTSCAMNLRQKYSWRYKTNKIMEIIERLKEDEENNAITN